MLLLSQYSFFDFLASHPALFVIGSIILSVLLYFLIFRPLFAFLFSEKIFLNKIEYMLPFFFAVPAVTALPVFNYSTFGAKFGYTDNKPSIAASDSEYIYLISNRDKRLTFLYKDYRLHKIEMQTGNEAERHLLTRNLENFNSAIIGNMLWVEIESEKMLLGTDLTRGNKKTIDENTLMDLDAQSRKAGIQSFSADFSKPGVNVFRKDGSETFLNPFETGHGTSVQVFHQQEFNAVETSGFSLTGNAQKKLSLNGIPVLSERFWINGSILAYDTANKLCIIASYLTTENKEPVLEAISFDAKTVWKISVPDLPEGETGNYFISGKELFIIIGTHLTSINMQNGKINWVKRL